MSPQWEKRTSPGQSPREPIPNLAARVQFPTPQASDWKNKDQSRDFTLGNRKYLWPTARTRGLLGGSGSREMIMAMVEAGELSPEEAREMIGVRLPTPKAREAGWRIEGATAKDGGPPRVGERVYKKGVNKTWGLQQAIAFWPTPRSMDGKHGARTTPRPGKDAKKGPLLAEAVAARDLWPTPTVEDAWGQIENQRTGKTLRAEMRRSMWPTPMVQDSYDRSNRKTISRALKGEAQMTLTRAVKGELWPTPVAKDAESAGGRGATERGTRRPSLSRAAESFPTPLSGSMNAGYADRRKDAHHHGNELLRRVREGRLPTPQAVDSHGHQYTYNPRTKEKQLSLLGIARAIEMLPTPGANDWKGSSEPGQRRGQLTERAPGGQLNPTWVEWLMGFPLGWTDLGASATRSSRRSRRSSASASSSASGRGAKRKGA